MSGKAAELEKVEEILADPSGQTSQYFYYCYHLKVIWAFNFIFRLCFGNSCVKIAQSELLIDLATHSNWPKNCQIGRTPAALLAHANCNGQKTVKSLPAVTILDNFHGS